MTVREKPKLHLLNPGGKSIYCTGRSVARFDSQVSVTNSPAHVTCLVCLRRMHKAKRDAAKFKAG